MIEKSKWYRVNNKHLNHMFIKEVKALYDADDSLDVPPEAYEAECLKYNPVGHMINYRTTYRPDYMREVELYVPQAYEEAYKAKFGRSDIPYEIWNKKEGDNKMNNYSDEIDTLIRDYIDAQVTNIEKTTNDSIQAVFLNTELGKAAQNFINQFELTFGQRKDIMRPTIEAFMVGIIDELAEVKDIRRMADKSRCEVYQKVKELKALLSIAETYDQKKKLLVKYGIIKR